MKINTKKIITIFYIILTICSICTIEYAYEGPKSVKIGTGRYYIIKKNDQKDLKKAVKNEIKEQMKIKPVSSIDDISIPSTTKFYWKGNDKLDISTDISTVTVFTKAVTDAKKELKNEKKIQDEGVDADGYWHNKLFPNKYYDYTASPDQHNKNNVIVIYSSNPDKINEAYKKYVKTEKLTNIEWKADTGSDKGDFSVKSQLKQLGVNEKNIEGLGNESDGDEKPAPNNNGDNKDNDDKNDGNTAKSTTKYILASPGTKTIDNISVNDYDAGDIKASDAKAITNKASYVLGIIRNISAVVAVIVLMIIGIKYMLGSAEEKADYKATMVLYIIGCVLAVSSTTLASFIYNAVH